jgi:hypothetical protein
MLNEPDRQNRLLPRLEGPYPPRDTVCRLCGRSVQGHPPICFCCRLSARQLHLPVVPTVVMTEYRVGDADHARLRGYKDARNADVRCRYRAGLVAEVALWLDRHGGALVDRFGPWSIVTSVPSTRSLDRTPASALADGVPALADLHRVLLIKGSCPPGHLDARRDGFELRPGIDRAGLDGVPVLVFDDSVTTGARSQSAAATLRLAGAQVVGVLGVGRALPARAPSPVSRPPSRGSNLRLPAAG